MVGFEFGDTVELNSCVMHRFNGPTPGVMVQGGIGFHYPNPLVRIATEERSFSNGSHWSIAAFMEMNKPTSWPNRLRRCIHLAFRCLFESPSDFSGTNCDRREFYLLQTWLLANLSLVCSTDKDVLSFLSFLGWRVWHASESSPDMITCKPICLR
ncbi:hypothetical protein TNCV_1953851 [Trichonephila clavipes]|nr:hypothetical protein TNCV_1953851 [Trichonephila clavipes]